MGRGIARAGGDAMGRDLFDRGQVLLREPDFERRGVFFQVRNAGGSRNGYDVFSLSQEPSQAELRGLDFFLRGDLLDPFYEVQVFLEILFLKPGKDPPAVVRLQIVDAFYFPAQKPASDRTVCHKADAKIAA